MREPKRVFAFDTFEGFKINDPAGGPLGIGSYSDNDNAFAKLRCWSHKVPVVPVKGDATETYKILTTMTDGLLSFVWLDLDMDVLMEPVLQGILPLLSKDTIIGVDDYGRPECPTLSLGRTGWNSRAGGGRSWSMIGQISPSTKKRRDRFSTTSRLRPRAKSAACRITAITESAVKALENPRAGDESENRAGRGDRLCFRGCVPGGRNTCAAPVYAGC